MDVIDLIGILGSMVIIYHGVVLILKKPESNFYFFQIAVNDKEFVFRFSKDLPKEDLEKSSFLISELLKTKEDMNGKKEYKDHEISFYKIKTIILVLADVLFLDKHYIVKFLNELSDEIEIRKAKKNMEDRLMNYLP